MTLLITLSLKPSFPWLPWCNCPGFPLTTLTTPWGFFLCHSLNVDAPRVLFQSLHTLSQGGLTYSVAPNNVLCWQLTSLFLDLDLVWASSSFIHLPVRPSTWMTQKYQKLHSSQMYHLSPFPTSSPNPFLSFVPFAYRDLKWNRLEFESWRDLESTWDLGLVT